jgi:hypothetical protein
MFASILVISSSDGAREVERPVGTGERALNPGKATGILTDRLTKSQVMQSDIRCCGSGTRSPFEILGALRTLEVSLKKQPQRPKELEGS